MTLQLAEHLGDLIGVEYLNLDSGHLWRPDRSGHVALKDFNGGGVGQGRPEEAVGVPDGPGGETGLAERL